MKYIIRHEISIEIPDDTRELDNQEIIQIDDFYIDHDFHEIKYIKDTMIGWVGKPYYKGLANPIFRESNPCEGCTLCGE